MTPLTALLAQRIEADGPMSLADYMAECLLHPRYGYYATRDPFGRAGDFITAPEISQMFGELVGLWLTDMWIRAGREEPVHYIELGPGRGTLAQDALRTARRYGLEPSVHFVESSTALKDIQLVTVPGAQWHYDLSTTPPYGPVLIVANEFLDALPVRQLVMTENGWRERMVIAEGERFACVAGPQPMDAAVPEARRAAPVGTILETCPGAAATVYEVAGRLIEQGGAALFIDYGHDELRDGSTLQAVRDHLKVDPFINPGEADLTASYGDTRANSAGYDLSNEQVLDQLGERLHQSENQPWQAAPALGSELRLVFTPGTSTAIAQLHDGTTATANGTSAAVTGGSEYHVFTLDIDARCWCSTRPR